ncbi:phosphatidate cytidylyltransferase [Lactococcus garvieae]|mgnify:CR=1 FL=1|jgi:phosphatidate cytidylyltransferase|uniref:Phosphatidate cytidylyltransferase n=1 Tax=Lactococcus garvieae DCC43 TaxID=1231377 RepID=K2PI98_9LACT|nr:phosphatidate cytidylyltransferase [Lactococcus garvieae]EKF51145.1 Phosphatidate cytidylyltransferase [Lactococcus garvieae DCC43]QPS70704.1 phosphatidate cytidylyltransferase [Lactococcus garvieae]
MIKRIITAIIGGAVFIGLMLMGGAFFQIFIAILVMLAMNELFKMHKLQLMSFEGILSTMAALCLALPIGKYFFGMPTEGSMLLFMLCLFAMLTAMVLSKGSYNFDDIGFPFLSAFYVGIGFQSLLLARESGLAVVFLALFIVWATDIGAYFVGKSIGKRKLIPEVSPNKTVEGSIGGVASAVVVAILMFIFYKNELPQIGFIKLILFTIVFSIVGQIGDLVESSIKRHYGVKDSGKLLPGHGGVLDRFDNLIFVFPIMHLLGLF